MNTLKQSFKNISIKEIINKPISGEWGEEVNELNTNIYKVIRTTNFTNNGKLNLKKEVVSRKVDPQKAGNKMLKYGDIIIEKSGGSPTQPVGRVVFFDLDEPGFLCNNFTSILRAKELVYPKYLFFVLFNNHLTKKTLNFQNKTTGIINLQLERYLELSKISLPPLETQKKIAEAIDKAQELIDKRKEQIEKLDEFIKSVFLDMFGDPVKNPKGWGKNIISNLCSEIVDCVNKTAPQSQEKTPYKMIRTSNIKNGKIDLTNVKYVEEATYKKWTRRSTPQKGDILLTREAPMGEVGIIDFDDNVFLGQRIMQYRCDTDLVNPKYLIYLVQSDYFQNQIRGLGKGSTVKHLAVPDCYKFNVILPPINLQNKFAAVVEKIEQQKGLLQKSLTEMENNFNSIMQKAFRGELFTN